LHAINDKDNLQRFDKMQIAVEGRTIDNGKWAGWSIALLLFFLQMQNIHNQYSVPRTRAASAFSMFFMLIYEYKSLSPRPSHAWEHSAYA